MFAEESSKGLDLASNDNAAKLCGVSDGIEARWEGQGLNECSQRRTDIKTR